MDNTTFAIIVNTVANAVSCVSIVIGAYYLRLRRDNMTARYLSVMLYGVGAEIAFATTALYFLDNLWVWIGLRLTGRAVEFVVVARFLNYLLPSAAVKTGVKPAGGDAGP